MVKSLPYKKSYNRVTQPKKYKNMLTYKHIDNKENCETKTFFLT